MSLPIFLTCLYLSILACIPLSGQETGKMPMKHQMLIQHSSYHVLGLGSSCIDLLIPVNDEFLSTIPGKKGGAEEISFSQLTQIIANSGTEPTMATGGSCANTLKGIASLGGRCALVGKVGADSWGDFFIQNIRKAGVISLLHEGRSSSPCVLCLITPDGQRTMRFSEGCSREMTPDYLHSDYLKDVKLVHVEGYALRNPGLVKQMMQLAKQAQVPVSFDPSSFEIIEEHYVLIHELMGLQYIDIIFANVDETFALTGLPPKEGCNKLREYCSKVVILQGGEGCLVGHSDGIFHSPAFISNVVDTTGAGDLFASGFLYGYINGASLEKCALYGNLIGKNVVEVVGAEIPDERWADLRQAIVK